MKRVLAEEGEGKLEWMRIGAGSGLQDTVDDAVMRGGRILWKHGNFGPEGEFTRIM